ncbi:MAG: hypothetical protein IKD28_01435 [Clostridia bacterium]|nr:hypothetical protein [Clostridia bacterium]
MKLNLQANGHTLQADLLRERLAERIPVEYCADGLTVSLTVDETIGKPDSYIIFEESGAWQVVGANDLGLSYGVGKLLHSAKWEKESFVPVATDGVVTPACSYRGVYYSKHFYNWYQMAPMEEQERYLADLLLWGHNLIHCTLPTVNSAGFDDPVFTTGLETTRRIFKMAKKLGMKTSLSIGSNQGMKNAPEAYNADMSFDLTFRGNLGRNLCPNKPEALAYLRELWRHKLQAFADIGLDYISCWPYDEGGCGCEKCRPWGKNGYGIICKAVAEEAKKVFPNVQVVASTWAFDAPNDEGEYEGFYERLTGDLADSVDYLMVDAHGDFPRYPLEHKPVKPIVNFPEISMWGLAPWGGFGANPLPERFQRIWDSSKHILDGGLPYSEGIYEDILKIQCMGYYWSPDKHYSEILAEYINYEYSAEVVEDCLELMRLIEINHTHIGEDEMPDMSVANKALALAKSIDARLDERAKNAWRWRILYIRAVVDQKRYQALVDDPSDDPKKIVRFHYYSGDRLLDDAEAQALFLELWGYYHCVPHNGENHHTLPPYGGTKLDFEP